MTTKDKMGFNTVDKEELEQEKHGPGPAMDYMGFNTSTKDELKEEDDK